MIRLQQHKHVLGSEAFITLVAESEAEAQQLFEDIWQELQLFEQTFSRFLPDSELSQVNERAGLPTEVSKEFLALYDAAREYMDKSGGLYNPLILPVLQRAGYKGSWPSPDTPGEAPDYTSGVFGADAVLQSSETSVTIPRSAALDFGGIGKGYVLDMLGQLLRNSGVTAYWLSLGGDIYAAGADLDGSPWVMEIADASDETKTIASFSATTKAPFAIATSGTLKRAGKGWNHLIDPRTGKPTRSDILSATVIADSGVAADVSAKCLLLAGSMDAPKLARKLGVSSYLMQLQSKEGTVEVIKQGDFN